MGYKGLGQVAESGFKNNQWIDGQLIMVKEEYFSFAWAPIEQQIFFGRPSPELIIKMMRESGGMNTSPAKSWEQPPALDSDVDVLKEYANSCLEKTTEHEEESLNGDAFGCIWADDEDIEECFFQ